jgi:phage terminase large subunit GpA-like protein
MSYLTELMKRRIQIGLQRKAVTSCSAWAMTYRIMGTPYPGKWTFTHHPWLKEMHDSESEMIVGQKAAQLGYTEFALNLAFYYIDIKATDVLYVLPSKTPDASDFSASRFDGALELSQHLTDLFSDVKNVGHKRAGAVNMYVRGSKSRPGLKSIPVGLVILDEVDEFEQKNIPLAMERLSGQVERKIAMLSTPTIEERGINFLL